MLREMITVPGDLFAPLTKYGRKTSQPVCPQRSSVICLFDTEFGPMAQILVGATIVGDIRKPSGRGPLPHAARRHHQALDVEANMKGLSPC